MPDNAPERYFLIRDESVNDGHPFVVEQFVADAIYNDERRVGEYIRADLAAERERAAFEAGVKILRPCGCNLCTQNNDAAFAAYRTRKGEDDGNSFTTYP